MPAEPRSAFLLSQLGSVAAARFGELISELGMTPPDAGVLRIVAGAQGISQRALADRLGIVPSRVVALVDSLESRGLVARSRSSTDRRAIELNTTAAGDAAMTRLRSAAQKQEELVVGALSRDERSQLHLLLSKLAEAHRLDGDVHPGYRS